MSFNIYNLYFKTIGRWLPTDLFSYRQPVSVKGVCFIDERVVLLRDLQGNWDLPGGKLSRGETIESCLIRELQEELGIAVATGPLIMATQRRINGWVNVVVLIYSCFTTNRTHELRISPEHSKFGCFTRQEAEALVLPEAYKQAIGRAARQGVTP